MACLSTCSNDNGTRSSPVAFGFEPAAIHQHNVRNGLFQGQRGSDILRLFALESDDDDALLSEYSRQEDRRSFLTSSAAAFLSSAVALNNPLGAIAADESAAKESREDNDLTAQLFNADGSLREGVESEAKFRPVQVDWSGNQVASNQRLVNANGVDKTVVSSRVLASAGETSGVRVTYDLPAKWGTGSELYLDRNDNNLKACNRITVYQAPVDDAAAFVDYKLLEKAPTIGIAKALSVPDDMMSELRTADLIGGRTRKVGSEKYFDFDMAVAPKTCSDDGKENLGLGFCPFESIYLLSSTIVNGRLYAFVLECDKVEWKRSNSDLRKVRSTFTVATL